VAFFDHDDLLTEDALYHVARAVEEQGKPDLIYTDEDKVSADLSEYFQPNFKPDFNLDLLRSNNYICHLLVVKASLAKEVGGLDPAYDGAQDYDFIFRCVEKAKKVVHIPKVLYHWRIHSGSTADNPFGKDYALEAGQRAIEAHLERTGTSASVSMLNYRGFYRVKYQVQGEPLITIIIPNKDNKETLKECLDSIKEQSTYKNYEILIVENNSTKEETFDYYQTIDGKDGVRVLYWDREFNYSAINNFGASKANGDYLIFLNNDITVITPDWMEELLGHCQRKEVGITGARLYFPDDTIQHAGIVMGIGGCAGNMFVGMKRAMTGYMHRAILQQDMSAVTAACLMVKWETFQQIGGLDECLAVAFNDVDFCLRAREAGWLVVYDPYVEMYHHESKTRGYEDTEEKKQRFEGEKAYLCNRWEKMLEEGDPYYNRNLSYKSCDYSIQP
jgi:GT2 family glycosyltransferase